MIRAHSPWSTRKLYELRRERARRSQTTVRDLAREDGLHHLAQTRGFLDVAPLLCFISKIVVHGTTDGRADPIAAHDKVARGRRPILEVERDGVGGRGLRVRHQAFRKVGPVPRVEVFSQELLEDRSVESVRCGRSPFRQSDICAAARIAIRRTHS